MRYAIRDGGMMFKDFKTFLLRGNVIDLAVAVVVGTAFNAVVSALVKDILTPLLGIFGKGPSFTSWSFAIGHAQIQYGDFVNALVSFFVIAATVYFLVVHPIAALTARRKPQIPPADSTKECPFCLSKVPEKAGVCAFCTRDLTAAA